MEPVIAVLYEDDDVMVIDKPSGIVTNNAASVQTQTVQDWAANRLNIKKHEPQESDSRDDIQRIFTERSGIAHRLDKDTSGCLIVAKHPKALAALLHQFKERLVHKEYTALAHGGMTPESGTITAPIGRLPWRRGLFGVMPGGKHAVTHYQVAGRYRLKKEEYSLVNVTIETGRTHQIRVHLQYSNHPVVGDIFYAGRKRTRASRLWCPRLFLHARTIEFNQPLTGKQIVVSSPLPEELQEALNRLEKVAYN